MISPEHLGIPRAMTIIRDSVLGTCIRFVSSSRLLAYPEHRRHRPSPDFDDQFHPTQEEEKPNQKGIQICDWYDKDDLNNPRNWSSCKKLLIVFGIASYAFVVYMSAPIWTSSEEQFMDEFGTGYEYTALGLALFVLGYGTGPLLFSPLSEIPSIGRNPPYVVTFIIFMAITIPTALVRNAPAFMFLRFVQGFFGSPVLATGGASIADVYDDAHVSIAMSAWGFACFVAPPVGTTVAAAAINHLGWRFSIWEILIASAPVLVVLLILPETNPDTILYYRAQRLREATGNEQIRSQAEINQSHLDFRSIVVESLFVPAAATIQDPAVLFVNVYLMLIYAIYYSFFEAFPLVYQGMYGFDLLQLGLSFMPIAVGTAIGSSAYIAYLWFWRRPNLLNGTPLPPETILRPALIASFFPPIGLFLFGWSSNPNIHWIVSMIGVAIYPLGVFVIFQTLLVYLAACYPRFAASLFAGTDFTRSAFALAAVLFARPMFRRLGIGGGCSLLAGLMIGCIAGIFALYRYGAALRRRSKFTAKF